MDDFTDVKIEVFVPQEHMQRLRETIGEAGAGHIGHYDHCMTVSPVQGSWRPLPGAKPFDGEVGKLSEAPEFKIEVNCKRDLVKHVIQAIRADHPYEEPVINVIPLVNALFE